MKWQTLSDRQASDCSLMSGTKCENLHFAYIKITDKMENLFYMHYLILLYQLQNIGIKEIKKDGEEGKQVKQDLCSRLKSIFDPPVLKNRTFWIIMGIFFFFKFGM